jgi:hypothetical protein
MYLNNVYFADDSLFDIIKALFLSVHVRVRGRKTNAARLVRKKLDIWRNWNVCKIAGDVMGRYRSTWRHRNNLDIVRGTSDSESVNSLYWNIRQDVFKKMWKRQTNRGRVTKEFWLCNTLKSCDPLILESWNNISILCKVSVTATIFDVKTLHISGS